MRVPLSQNLFPIYDSRNCRIETEKRENADRLRARLDGGPRFDVTGRRVDQSRLREAIHDKASGAKADRPGLADALRFARAGDTLVIWKLDRLGRSIGGLVELAADLSARKVDFRSLTDGFDTSTPSGRLLFHILASVAEMERELIKERTIAGLAAARAKGGTGGGRKSAITPDKLDTARKLLAAGDKPARVAKLLQVGLSTFYRHFPASEREPA